MNKTELIANYAKMRKRSLNEAANDVNNFLECIESALKSGEEIKITGFGTFCVRQYKEKAVRVPLTGEMTTVPEQKRVSFKSSKTLNANIDKAK